MTRLLSRLDVMPEFYKYLSTFGMKNFDQDQSFSGHDAVTFKDEAGLIDRFGTTPFVLATFQESLTEC